MEQHAEDETKLSPRSSPPPRSGDFEVENGAATVPLLPRAADEDNTARHDPPTDKRNSLTVAAPVPVHSPDVARSRRYDWNAPDSIRPQQRIVNAVEQQQQHRRLMDPGSTASGARRSLTPSPPPSPLPPEVVAPSSVRLAVTSGPIDTGADRWRRVARSALSGPSAQLHFALRAGTPPRPPFPTAATLSTGTDSGDATVAAAVADREDGQVNVGEFAALFEAAEREGIPLVGGIRRSEGVAEVGVGGRGGDAGGTSRGDGDGEGTGDGGGGVAGSELLLNGNGGLPPEGSAVEPTAVEIRQALESSQNTLPLLLLLVVHYIFTHAVGISVFFVGTAVLAGLDKQLRAQADVRDAKTGVVLICVALLALVTVFVSSVFVTAYFDGEGLLAGLLLVTPDLGGAITLTAVVRTVAVVDLWARLLSIAIKAVIALLANRSSRSSNDNNANCCSYVYARSRAARSCSCFGGRRRSLRRRRPTDPNDAAGGGEGGTCVFNNEGCFFRRAGRGGGVIARGGSPSPAGHHLGGAAEVRSDGAGLEAEVGRSNGGTISSQLQRALCGRGGISRRWCGGLWRCVNAHCIGSVVFGPCCFALRRRRGDDGGGDGRRAAAAAVAVGDEVSSLRAPPRGYEVVSQRDDDDDDEGREGGGEDAGAGALLGRGARQRRICALVEMAFMLYRTLLPVPVWLEYYNQNGEHFAAIYLVLKGMVVYYRADRLARALCYVRRGELERGKFATPQEVAEAGSPDCPICYERMDRPVLLPCHHMFCGACVSEWLERERTCPLCRLEIPTSNPIPRGLRKGQTAIVPQVL